MRPLHAGIILFHAMYLVVDENTRFLRGAGQRVTLGFAAVYRLFLLGKA